MYIIMGLNAPNSKFFCLYCNCKSEIRWNMDQSFENSGNTACMIKRFYYLLFIYYLFNILINFVILIR
jgi:hypothetical protein